MDITLREDQLTLRESAKEFLEAECPKDFVRAMEEDDTGYTPEFWKKLADLGWLGYVLPEEYGGRGGDFFDLSLIVEQMGYAAMPGPFFSTVVLGAHLVEAVGSDQQKKEILPQVAGGRMFLTTAIMEPQGGMTPGSIETAATKQNNKFVITGTKFLVMDAHIADYVVCVTRTGNSTKAEEDISLLLVPKGTAGVELTRLRTTAGDKQFEAIFDGTSVPTTAILGKQDQGWPSVDLVLQKAAALKSAEMIGVMQAALDIAIEYATQRITFGRPLGSAQAIQHHFADMWKELETSRLLTYEAIWRLSRGLAASKEVSLAKSRTNRAAGFVTRMAHQIHGGTGFYTDSPLEIYTRRAVAGQASFGDTQFHLDRAADHLDFLGR